MRPKKIVDLQNVRVRQQKGGYWDFVFSHNRCNDEGEYEESVLANPDQLSESDVAFKQRGPRELRAMQLLDEAVEKLTKKQRDAYVAYYRDGKSETEIALSLGIEQPAVAKLLQRALAYVTEYCRMRTDELDEAANGQD